METTDEKLFEQIKESMKQIVEQTNAVLKHSHSAFKKTKEKMINLETITFVPNEQIKQWFQKRNVKKCSIPDFFEILYKEASNENRLFYASKTIIFKEEDAKLLGYTPNVEISIYDLFESIPKYFH